MPDMCFNIEPISPNLPVTPLPPEIEARVKWVEGMLNSKFKELITGDS